MFQDESTDIEMGKSRLGGSSDIPPSLSKFPNLLIIYRALASRYVSGNLWRPLGNM
jgi:hypothetical protein